MFSKQRDVNIGQPVPDDDDSVADHLVDADERGDSGMDGREKVTALIGSAEGLEAVCSDAAEFEGRPMAVSVRGGKEIKPFNFAISDISGFLECSGFSCSGYREGKGEAWPRRRSRFNMDRNDERLFCLTAGPCGAGKDQQQGD